MEGNSRISSLLRIGTTALITAVIGIGGLLAVEWMTDSPAPGESAPTSTASQPTASAPASRPADSLADIPPLMTIPLRAVRQEEPTTMSSDPETQSADTTDNTLPALAAPRIVIERSRRRLTVYDGDRAVKIYDCITGRSPGSKTREGDRKTPEGEFFVCVRNPVSRYTLSLGLNYPTADDAARGLRDELITKRQHDLIADAARHRRRPPWNTKLGGEIMIHGKRRDADGQPRDGTLGCIALDDADIRELYPRIPLGTAVIIRP